MVLLALPTGSQQTRVGSGRHVRVGVDDSLRHTERTQDYESGEVPAECDLPGNKVSSKMSRVKSDEP